MSQYRKLYIVGAGGFGREVLWLAERMNKQNEIWDIQGFIDDDQNTHGQELNGKKVLGGCTYLENLTEDVYVICAIGSAKTKKCVVDKLSKINGIHFATLVDPSVMMSDYVQIGEGSIICAGTILTTNITIGRHVIINLDCTLGHDDVIGDYVTLYPSVNISGNVMIDSMSEIGTGSQIIQGKKIAKNVVVGAGAVVVRNIKDAGTYIGVPARKIHIE